ncbi:MAG TPA: enoyl-CoA hydratase-related protein [Candidatus Methylomirabilis sp.]|nr:enoyl-CoA hydratase-related protein [Candidatus Methylomirabilis sp.]
MTGELVRLEVSRGVGTITLDSPHNRNALSRQLIADLGRHIATALDDPGVRVIVLTGAPPAFCSGADLKERRDDRASSAGRGSGLVPILTAMWEGRKPIVGRINGPARAGGVGLVAACDVAVAAERATFAVNEVRIGVIPGVVSVVLLPKIGQTRAMELFLTGDQFDARAAVAYGLVTAVAPDDGLDAAVDRYVASLLKGAPKALAGCKRLVRDVPTLAMEAAFAEMAERSARFFASDEAREGLTAFAEKRPPRWAREG